jgi:hypothetical protein
MKKSKQLIIHIKEIQNQKIIGFELKDFTKDEAIIILNRCLFRLLDGYDDYIDVKQ